MKLDLQTLSEQVCDEDSFIAFLIALGGDREEEAQIEAQKPSSPFGPGASGWENGTIESFLGAAAAWAKGSQNGMPHYSANKNPWARCATIFFQSLFQDS